MKILADATLPNISCFFKPEALTLYYNEATIPSLIDTHDVLLCRSTLKVTSKLLAETSIRCVATASSGTDHIDLAYLKSQGITLIDAKGSNARAVADYVTASLAFLQREKLLPGFRAGVVGFGEVGSRVALRLHAAELEVLYFDPFKALADSHFSSTSIDALTTCDLICIHANLHDIQPFPSNNLFNYELLRRLKSNAVIINASRGNIVNEKALLSLNSPLVYCTDVYSNEPLLNAQLVDYATLCTPHIAGHSIEAKQDAVVQVCQAIYRYFQLPVPRIDLPAAKTETISLKNNWQETILSLYNPLDDTQKLKRASDKKKAFLIQRQAHTTRHDFNKYAYKKSMTDPLSQLLGI
ncbi:MAG: NAD(P)-dependent oxidoreductase [Legionellaceae bacterium]|nr:NAD(P)-dependent oxidoreductase [Legionellaceae bacterium]